MSRLQYDQIEGERRTNLARILECPALYKYHKDNPDEGDTEDKLYGRLFHQYLLEPERCNFRTVKIAKSKNEKGIFEDGRPEKKKTMAAKANASWLLEEIQEIEAKGCEYVSYDHAKLLHDMRAAAVKNPLLLEYFSMNGKFEKVFTKVDQATGIALKCMVDKDLPEINAIFDLKTARSAKYENFMRDAHKYKLDFQAAMYLDISGRESFIFGVIEKKPPYLTAVYPASKDGFLDIGSLKYRAALNALKKCQDSDEWPSYSFWNAGLPQSLELPIWAQK